MKILRIYYPRKIRHLVRQFEREDRLNGDALFGYNYMIMIPIAIAVIFILIGKYIPAGMFVLLPFIIAHYVLKHRYIAYSTGFKKQAKLLDIKKQHFKSNWVISYMYDRKKYHDVISEDKKEQLKNYSDYVPVMVSPCEKYVSLYFKDNVKSYNLAK